MKIKNVTLDSFLRILFNAKEGEIFVVTVAEDGTYDIDDNN